ncbi:tyrosine-type recombinase/integrase [Bifidobacterium tissieri]|uniref:tyrosine-type recombinase/integrase n=1 Tax=Bifidobacterium tissieri TaxID=1630162 RepID=UPI00123840DA|nr:site-specific integrase [Bifidobacterium tissieri]KAA8831807.1 site-specific integrase [Bifidobacterium tissieri]
MSIETYENAAGVTRYAVRYRKPSGGWTRKRGFKRKRDAADWEAANTVSKRTGMWVDPTLGAATVGMLAPAWLAKKALAVKPSYLDDLEDAWRIHVAPSFEGMRVSDIRRGVVQEWVTDLGTDRLDDDGTVIEPGRSPSVVLRAHGVLAGILDDAVADHRIADNPARGVTLPRKRRKPHTYLTAGQLMRLANACITTIGERPPYEERKRRLLVLMLGTIGSRWGETIEIHIDEIDFDRHRIPLDLSATQVRGRIVLGTLKGEEARTVSFPEFLDPYLHDVIDGRENSDQLLFTGPLDGYMRQVDSPSKDGNWFSATCDRAGVPRMTMHDLRHTAASLMVRSGANVKLVQRQLGHKSAAMTLDVYADLFVDDLDSVASAMSEMLLTHGVSETVRAA